MCEVGVYLVADFPDRGAFLDAVSLCDRYGVDFLEVGFPFSDPVADGDVIEKAALSVLERENTPDFIEALRLARGVFSGKMYIMTYANIVYAYPMERFAREVSFIDGIILADVPFVESWRFERVFGKAGVEVVHFVTPESTYEDIDAIKAGGGDFIYFISVRGTTGSRFSLDEQTKRKIAYTKDGFDGRVILGFGIKNRDDIEEACRWADGVVIGTKAVDSLRKGEFELFLKDVLPRR